MGNTATLERAAGLTDFKTLSFEEQISHFHDVARRALGRWGYPEDAGLKLLNITENATFRVDGPDGACMVMRVHRIDYAQKDSIRTELAWLRALRAETDIHAVEPLPALDGDLVQTVATPRLGEERHVVCFAFVGGKAPRDSHDDNEDIGKLVAVLDRIPKAVTLPLFRFAAVAYDKLGARSAGKNRLTPGDEAMYRTLGRIAATIHLHAMDWREPAYYQRIEWDWDATFGKGWNNYYGAHYHQLRGMFNGLIKEKDIAAIDACAELMKRRVEAYGKSARRYGMIHSDLRMSNLLIEGETITVLDFDDCGKGWFMYDVACILGLMEHRPDLARLIEVIMEGYCAVRPVGPEEILEIQTFVMMRRIGLTAALMHILGHVHPGSGESAQLTPEILAFYAQGTAQLARKYLKAFKNLPLPAEGEHA